MIINIDHLVDNLPICLAGISKDYIFQYCNKSYEKWFSLDNGGAVGKSMAQVLGKQLFIKVKPFVEKALLGEECKFQLRHDFPDGIERQVLVQYSPYTLSNGRISGFCALISEL